MSCPPESAGLTATSGRILIVEDELDLVAVLEHALARERFQTCTAATGRRALDLACAPPRPDLVLLDLMLPDMAGLVVCEQLRTDPRTAAVPVVMMTARGAEQERIRGFEVGADDYVVKPFSMRELVLRIRAVLRRSDAPTRPRVHPAFGRLRIDAEGHRAWVDGDEVDLTALEFRLLAALVAARGRVRSREALLAEIWGMDADVTARTVDMHVLRLRRKLGPIGDYVQTQRSFGYRFFTAPGGDAVP